MHPLMLRRCHTLLPTRSDAFIDLINKHQDCSRSRLKVLLASRSQHCPAVSHCARLLSIWMSCVEVSASASRICICNFEHEHKVPCEFWQTFQPKGKATTCASCGF